MDTKQLRYQADTEITTIYQQYDRAEIVFEDMILRKDVIERELNQKLKELK